MMRMEIILDPEGAETAALHDLLDFQDQIVLEIGCGDGRLTWRYAPAAAHVTAIDPDPEEIALALENCPDGLRHKVDLLVSSLQDYPARAKGARFDTAILSWSL
jgi:predicted RNA methylase